VNDTALRLSAENALALMVFRTPHHSLNRSVGRR
jgi:hypothetical protein